MSHDGGRPGRVRLGGRSWRRRIRLPPADDVESSTQPGSRYPDFGGGFRAVLPEVFDEI